MNEIKPSFFQNQSGKLSVGKVMKFSAFIVSVIIAGISLPLGFDGLGYVIAFLGASGLMEATQKIADHGLK